MSDATIEPIRRPFAATVTPPGSKSLTNRALVVSALSTGKCALSNVLFADDTNAMLDGLRSFGIGIDISKSSGTVRVTGCNGKLPGRAAEIFCGNSGTTIRFLTALCALGHGTFTLDGNARMRQRPIGQLVEMLQNLGVRIEPLGQAGFPPLRVLADGLPGGIVHAVANAKSSQFLSAILMASPLARKEVIIDLAPNQPSWPYVVMTMRLMDEFGVTPELVRDPKTSQPTRIVVPQHPYRATPYTIEPDASSASYFLAIAAIHPGSKITIEGLGKHSLQGDVGFADILHRMGAGLVFGRDFITITGTDSFTGIEVDLSPMPDMAQTLGVVALFAAGQTVIRGLQTLRVKETDRLTAMKNELSKLGAAVKIEDDDTLIIDPPERPSPATIDTYDDHRMAMSFAVAGTRIPGLTIRDVECVNKTYPSFFSDLAKLN